MATILVVASTLVFGWWLLLKFRVVPAKLASIYCTFSIFCLVTSSSVATFMIDLLRRLKLVSAQRSGDLCSMACRLIFGVTFFMNPQINIVLDEREQKWSEIPARTCMLVNHTSFLDALVFTAASPMKFITNARTLMKASLRKLPIFGGVFDRVGHFPVYFKSDENGVFSVDKERQAVVNDRVLKHIDRDGRLTIFPEGQMNTNPGTLLPFRHGSFHTIMQNSMEMYYCAMWGNDQLWYCKDAAPTGGNQTIYIKIGRVGPALEGEDSVALSARVQGILQKAVSELEQRAISEGNNKPRMVNATK